MTQTPSSQKKVLLTHLDWNLQRLDEALKQESTDYFKGATLQRFGHTYTMAIKSIRGFENIQEGEANDKHCIELANQNGWTENQPQWIEMIADYKRIIQKPDKQVTEDVYNKLPQYHEAIKYLYAKLQSLT